MDENTLASAPVEGSTGAAAAASPESTPVRRRGLPAWVPALLLLNLAAVGVLGWLSLESRAQLATQREDLARRLEAGDTVAKEARALARQAQETLGSLQSRLGVVEDKVLASEGQAAALEALYAEFSRSRDDRLLAEVELSLHGAAQQLQLAGNVEVALIALQGVDQRLAQLDRPLFLPLRQAIARDLEALRAAPQLDVTGLALRLDALAAGVDGLPLAFAGEASDQGGLAVPPAQAPEPTPMGFALDLLRELLGEVRKLVRIERLDGPAPVLLAPEQGLLLREGIKVRLLTARLSLLARDGSSYKADLLQGASLLQRHFDAKSSPVASLLQELERLAAVEFPSARPAITDSLSALAGLQSRAPVPLPAAPPPVEPVAAPAPAVPANPARPGASR